MFSFTRQERQLITLILLALVIGVVVKQWRSSIRMKDAIELIVVKEKK